MIISDVVRWIQDRYPNKENFTTLFFVSIIFCFKNQVPIGNITLELNENQTRYRNIIPNIVSIDILCQVIESGNKMELQNYLNKPQIKEIIRNELNNPQGDENVRHHRRLIYTPLFQIILTIWFMIRDQIFRSGSNDPSRLFLSL